MSDHDYSDNKSSAKINTKDSTLSAEEEKMISEITKALEESLQPTSQEVPTTPELLDLLSFDEVKPPLTLNSDYSTTTSSPVVTPPSPITKEEILDFLQDHETGIDDCPVTGSESGYDSVHSPFSYSSERSEDFSFEQDDCNSNELFQLFPDFLGV